MLGRGESVQGEFEVVRVEPYDLESGRRTDTVTGRLVQDGRPGAVVAVTRTSRSSDPPPEPGTRLPARWRRGRSPRVHVDWEATEPGSTPARVERDRRAAALGIDPRTLTADAVPPGVRPHEALALWMYNGALLPDGSAPVFEDEADRLKAHGLAAEAVIVAVDVLRALPGTAPSGGTVANVALDVTLADGTTYRALGRFGFRTDARRRQVGVPGARVPVRVDRSDRTRVTLDSARLPLLPD